MKMVLQTNELLERNQTKEINQLDVQQTYALGDGPGGFMIAGGAVNKEYQAF